MLKRLSNLSEQRLYEEIVGTVMGYRAEIYRKVRIADVVDITALPSRSIGTYALQAHFDLCVCDQDQLPQFVIEFDGAAHDHRNDARKDAIAVAADLAMFRVDETLLGRNQRGMTFLQYLVHTWFLSREFHRMRDAGEVSGEEPFVMSGFLKAGATSVFDSDFDFRMPAIGKLNRMMKRWGYWDGPLNHFRMSSLIIGRDDSSFIGFAAIPVGRNVACGRARIDIGTPCLGGLEELPFGWSALSDFAEGLMVEDLCDSVEMIVAGAGHATRQFDDVLQEIRDLTISGYTLLRGMSGPGTPDLETAMLSPWS
jgi:hypothetical protein